MLIEVTVLEGIELALEGKEVWAVDIDGTASTVNMTKYVELIKGLRFLIDPPADTAATKMRKNLPKPETPEEQKIVTDDPTPPPLPEAPKKKKRGRKPGWNDGEAEQAILKAWAGGDRKIKEIMEITGYSYKTVRKYIPETPAG